MAELRNDGFSVAVDQTDQAHFGDRLLELTDGQSRVRLISDRGQWAVDVAVGIELAQPLHDRPRTYRLAVHPPRAQQ
jgi:hypothetical protein